MLGCFCCIVVIIFQVDDADCILLVYPEDVVVQPGDTALFHCVTNASSTERGNAKWLYTKEKNFLSPRHIYARGRMFPHWRTRHNVTESIPGYFTLTINPVTNEDVGFYTCIDGSDDSKATAELKLDTEVVSSLKTSRTITEVTNLSTPTKNLSVKGLKQKLQNSETVTAEKGYEDVSRDMSLTIVVPVVLLNFVSLTVVMVIVGVCLWRRRSKIDPVNEEKHSDRATHPDIAIPVALIAHIVEESNDYEEIPAFEDEEMSKSIYCTYASEGQWNAAADGLEEEDSEGYVKVQVSTMQSPVYDTLHLNNNRKNLGRCIQCIRTS